MNEAQGPVQATRSGFTALRLSTGRIEVEVLPELGARLSSLRDRQTGREWMWQPEAGAHLRRNRIEDPFPESPLLGADECLPTLAACSWKGRSLPDHGEAWSQAWDVDIEGAAIRTRIRLPLTPLLFERTLTAHDATLELRYRLTCLGVEPEEFIWALHPMMTVLPGDRLRLPSEVDKVRTDSAIGFQPAERGNTWSWIDSGWDRVDEGGRSDAVKFYSAPLREGWAEIINRRTGDGIRYEWDAAELDTLGVWINRGGWDGHRHVAIEPAIGAPDPLDTAVRDWKRHGCLNPGETRAWTLRIIIGGAGIRQG